MIQVTLRLTGPDMAVGDSDKDLCVKANVPASVPLRNFLEDGGLLDLTAELT